MRGEVVEALMAAQEAFTFLRNNIDPSGEGGMFEIDACDDASADTLCALLNEAEERVASALHGLEIDLVK